MVMFTRTQNTGSEMLIRICRRQKFIQNYPACKELSKQRLQLWLLFLYARFEKNGRKMAWRCLCVRLSVYQIMPDALFDLIFVQPVCKDYQ